LKLVANGGPTQAIATQNVAPAAPVARGPQSFIRTVAAPAAVPTMRPAVVDPTPEPQPVAEPEPIEAYAPQAPVEPPIVVGPAVTVEPVAPRQAEPARPAAPGMMSSLFKRATSVTGMMRRTLPEAQPAAPMHAVRVEPSVVPQHSAPAPRPAPRQAQSGQDEMGLEIPTFLRRQHNP
jgi:hypothetical protein